MANPIVLLDARTFVSGADLSGSGNKIEITEESEAKATTNWRSGGAREVKAGLTSTEINAEGQWEAGNIGLVDDSFWANRRVKEPWSVAPESDSDLAAGGLMYLARALRTKLQWWGNLGDVGSWMANAVGTWPLVRGACAHASGVPRTATGDGTAVQLGAVAAGEHLYANLHVLSISGTAAPTITVEIESDDNSGFTSATSRGSFAARTTVGGEAIRIAGPFTDTYWRASWTISGTNPSFLFLVSFGIE
jgi:hypothetical protein